MTRKLTAATLALTVAGGVYLMAGPAQASNMGFKLERSFAVVRATDSDPTTSFQNIYLLSFPFFNGLGDVGSTAASGDKCAAGPDGTTDSVDAICDLFTDRATRGNSFAFSRFNPDTCAFVANTCAMGAFGLAFNSTNFALERDGGYWITVSATAAVPPQNRAVVVGSHDPSFTGTQVRQPIPDCAPRLKLLNLVYHSMYTKANEILCGLEGTDWVDADGNGNPDTCGTRGIYDGAKAMAVGMFDNIKDANGTDNQFVYRSVTFSLGQNRFSGPNFDLTPGDAYIASISPGHTTTTFLSPHF